MSDEIEISDDEAELLRREIKEIEAEDRSLQVQSIAAAQKNAPLRDEEKILREKLVAIQKQKQEAEESIRVARNRRKELETLKLERERKLRAFMSEKALKAERDRLDFELEQLCAEQFWSRDIMWHQRDGAKRLASAKRAILGDIRGLGKTLTSIAWLDLVSAKKTLIFTPTDVANNFLREVNRWAPNRSVVVAAKLSPVMRNAMFKMAIDMEEVTFILNYQAWNRDPTMVQRLVDIGFDTIILDEVHNIKNIKGVAFDGIKEIVYSENKCPECGAKNSVEIIDKGFNSTTRCRNCLFVKSNQDAFCSVVNLLAMSGTTILNRPDDIFGPLHLVDRKQFRSQYDFLAQYAARKSDGRWGFSFGGQERLLRRLGSRFIRRTDETAGIKFPPQERVIHNIEFDRKLYPLQWKVLQEIKQFGAIKMSEDVALAIPVILAEITRRRQAICWPGGIVMKDGETGEILYRSEANESIKIDKAIELIKEIVNEDGDRVVLFCTFTEALIELKRRLDEEGISAVRYDGSTPDVVRDEVQLDFDIKTASKEDYKWSVFLGQYQSASTGLNLTGARQMILLDRYWSPGREAQAEGRIQRLDSIDDSIVHVLHVDGSIDDWMEKLIEYKRDEIDGLNSISDKEEFGTFMRQMMTDSGDDIL